MFNSIVNKLEELNNLVPEQRFGQILYNYFTSLYENNDTFYVEDADVLANLTSVIEEIESDTKVRQMRELDQHIQELREKRKALETTMTNAEKKQYKKYFTNEVM